MQRVDYNGDHGHEGEQKGGGEPVDGGFSGIEKVGGNGGDG